VVEGFIVHEVVQLAVRVQVGDVVEVEAHILHALSTAEGALDVGARHQVARLDADGGVAAPGLIVAVVQHFVERAVHFEGHAFAKFVYINHAYTFLVIDLFIAGGIITKKEERGKMKENTLAAMPTQIYFVGIQNSGSSLV